MDEDSMRIDFHIHNEDVDTHAVLHHIVNLLEQIYNQGAKIMASFQEVSDELKNIKTAVDEAKATGLAQIQQIADLKAQIEAGSPVTQEQLDSLDAQADEILASLSSSEPQVEASDGSRSRNRNR